MRFRTLQSSSSRARGALALVTLAPFFAYACGGADDASNPDASVAPGNDASTDGTTTLDAAGDDDAVSVGDDDDDASSGGDGGGTMCADRNPLKNPYFGDLHSHTSYSFDAYSFDTRNTPLDAYAFAKGKTMQVAGASPDGGGPMTTIQRPLDFLAVTDHSEYLALAYGCGETLEGKPEGTPKAPYYDDPTCVLFRSSDPVQKTKNFGSARAEQNAVCDAGQCGPVVTSAWKSVQSAAAAAYEPCKFTSFVGYEWTHVVGGATLHKNVIFASAKVPDLPYDSINYATAPELWNALDQGCTADAGCAALTIPHNSNLSSGGAFAVPPGSEAQMMKYQRLVEIFQHKGGSECFYDPAHPTDPACDFEYLGGWSEPNLPASYVRTGIENGLAAYDKTKKNPLQLGFIGSTDDHNGVPGNTAESTWPGHVGRMDDSPEKRIGALVDGGAAPKTHGHNPGGVAVAWAEQNTRASIFAALARRETYATSGPRIIVRFYETWDTSADFCTDAAFPAQIVAAGGVPMGGTMKAGPAGGKPRLVAYAWKDGAAGGADLARIDIVKAWVDATGAVKEDVITNVPANGAASCVSWTDDGFTGTPTFYYARVLQAPTRRWSSYDCEADPTANPGACADGGFLSAPIQERAWTSPIWYLP